MFVTPANIRATLDETAEEEGELVCYLVDSPRNACYCIFVTFARSWVPFCVHCNVVFSIASLREGGRGTFEGDGRGFCEYQGNKDRDVLRFETQFKNSILSHIILLF